MDRSGDCARVMSGWGHDLRMALRAFRATPLVTAIAIASLALAIGANTAIFSIANSLLLNSLPVRDPGRLAHVTDSIRRDTGEIRVRAWSNPFWEQIRARPHLFESTTAWSFTRFDLAPAGETELVDGIWADGGFFETLGVQAVIGRTFTPLDDRPGGGPDGAVVVLGYGCWQRRFGGLPSVVGQTLTLNGTPFTIIGVTPREFFGLEVGRGFDVIVPLGTEALVRGRDSALRSASTNFLTIVARLKADQSPDAAASDLRAAQGAMREATLGPWDQEEAARYLASPFTVVPAATGYSNLRQAFARPLMIIGVVVALVLLIGCVNVANLQLARAIARRHELSVQIALGASRWRLGRQLFAESAALSVAGAALGLSIAYSGSRFLVGQLSTANPVVLDLSLDARVLAFTIGVTALTAVLFGTAPAFRAAHASPIEAIKERGRAADGGERAGLMTWLVVLQVTLSTVLLIGAGLFVRSFTSLAARDLGIKPDPVLVATIDPQRANVPPELRVALYERVRESVLQIPEVAAAGISHLTPVGGGGFTPPIAISTVAAPMRIDANGEVTGNLISPGWFDTFGMRLLAGRDFTSGDRSGAERVVVVNEAFAARYLSGTDPLAHAITIYPDTSRAMTLRIVGVVATAVYSSARDRAPATWFAPIAQFTVPGFPFSSARLSVRVTGGVPARLTKGIAAAATSVNPQLALTFRPLAGQVRDSLTLDRLMAQLAGFFGALALLLAGLGLYGVTAYGLSRRRTEIGIRLALGADPARVTRFVLSRVALLVVAGVATGVALSLWASKFVAGLLYGLEPQDPATLAGTAAVLLITGIAAAWFPVRRATRMDPGAVLREG